MNNSIYHKDYIFIGVILKPRGLKGHFFFRAQNNKSHISHLKIEKIFLKSPGRDEFIPFKLRSLCFEPKAVLELTEIKSREDLEPWLGAEIYIQTKDLKNTLSDDEILIHTLMGLKVCDVDDNYIGRVIAEYDSGAQVNLVIFEDGHNEFKENSPNVSHLFEREVMKNKSRNCFDLPFIHTFVKKVEPDVLYILRPDYT